MQYTWYDLTDNAYLYKKGLVLHFITTEMDEYVQTRSGVIELINTRGFFNWKIHDIIESKRRWKTIILFSTTF